MKGWMCGDEWGTKLCHNILSTVGPGIPFSPGSPFCPRGPGGPSVPLKPGGPGRPCEKTNSETFMLQDIATSMKSLGGITAQFLDLLLVKSMDKTATFSL